MTEIVDTPVQTDVLTDTQTAAGNVSKKNSVPGVSGAVLKMTAIVTMLIDHIGAVFCEQLVDIKITLAEYELPLGAVIYNLLRGIGRIAFPIFVFFLVEGFCRTRNRKKYALRLLLFSLISEVPFDLAFYGEVFYPKYQNVGFELLLAFLMMWVLDVIRKAPWEGTPGIVLKAALSAPTVAAFALLGKAGYVDYSYGGIVLAAFFYYHFHNENRKRWLAPLAGIVWCPFFEFSAIYGTSLCFLYNGKKGRQQKWFFYVFYPLHLTLLALIHYAAVH